MKPEARKSWRSLRAFYNEVATGSICDLAPRLTLVLLLLHSGYFWYLKVPMTFICAAAILYRTLYRSPWFWLFVSATLAWANFYNWFQVDNHKYLMLYWTIALHCAMGSKDPEATLRVNARWLIAGCMFFATFWKAISPDYLDGSFFEYSILLDSRFEEVAEKIGGLSEETNHSNRLLAGKLMGDRIETTSVTLASSFNVAVFGAAMTWFGILLEGLIALCFIAPNRSFLARWRDASLLSFIVITYALATVIGFGWLLSIMGFAHCAEAKRKTRSFFVASFFLIQIYLIPKSWILQIFE